MDRKVSSLVGVFFLLAVTSGLAQEATAPPAASIPAATPGEAECTGFISALALPRTIQVYEGPDNDFQQTIRQFATGDLVYLRSRGAESIQVGAEYRLVRPGQELFHNSWYSGQRWSIRGLGYPYEDAGRVKVVNVTPVAAIAEVTFACGPVRIGDIAVPYQPRAIPEYTPTAHLDRFAPPSGKLVGAITAAANNSGLIGKGKIVYLNLGEADGARAGQRYRVFRLFWDPLEGWLSARPDTPRETIGEIVILSTQEKSSVGIVVSSVREIFLRDGVELE